MTDHAALTTIALTKALDALEEAATELTLAVALSPPASGRELDALMLARAVELEAAAVYAVVTRQPL
jgi:hypothetical protein